MRRRSPRPVQVSPAVSREPSSYRAEIVAARLRKSVTDLGRCKPFLQKLRHLAAEVGNATFQARVVSSAHVNACSQQSGSSASAGEVAPQRLQNQTASGGQLGGQTGGKPRNLAGGVGANLLGSFRFAERLAGEPGFEPRLTESESAVLPLNYSPMRKWHRWA